MDYEGPPMTQSCGKSQVKYAWIILFQDDINEEEPFSVVPLNSFVDVEDFPWSVIKGEMSSERRQEIHQFSNLPGKYRIFGKIEKGKEVVSAMLTSMF